MKQSGVKIAYSSEELQNDRLVTVNIRTSDILDALRTVLGGNYTFKQVDDYIAIAKRPETETKANANMKVADERNWTIQG